jgi:hypothetical protein
MSGSVAFALAAHRSSAKETPTQSEKAQQTEMALGCSKLTSGANSASFTRSSIPFCVCGQLAIGDDHRILRGGQHLRRFGERVSIADGLRRHSEAQNAQLLFLLVLVVVLVVISACAMDGAPKDHNRGKGLLVNRMASGCH